ncbi:MAG: hypothetical protein U0694_22925 [Anaerolineae bacterium]
MRLALTGHWTPIAQAEYTHQTRSIAGRRSRWWITLLRRGWLALSVFAVVSIFLITLSASLGLFMSPQVPAEVVPLAFVVWILIPGLALFPTTVVLHFGLMLRTLLWAANSIPREKLSGTWDLLLLTGTPAREIVQSKWWATVRRAFPSYNRLVLLRFACVLWIIEWSRISLSVYPRLSFSLIRDDTSTIHPLLLLLGLLVMFLLTNANLLVTAALGMLLAFASKRSAMNAGVAAVVRTLLFIAPFFLLRIGAMFFYDFYYSPYPSVGFYFSMIAQWVVITLGDNGMMVTTLITSARTQYEAWYTDFSVALLGVGGALLCCGLVTLAALWGARRLALRQAALERAKSKK